MGNKIHTKSSFEENNWRVLSKEDYKTILHNDMTMRALEKHEAVSHGQQDDIAKIFKWRQSLSSESCVTQLYQYGINKEKGICNNGASMYVIVERLCSLSEVQTLSKPQAFLLIKDLATALVHLTHQFGFFLPRPEMIGINANGQGRMWINENQAICAVDRQSIAVQASQLTTLNNLIRLIQPKVYKDSNFPIKYPKNLSFSSAVTYIDKVFKEVKGFKVDKIYLDRQDFNKNYFKLRQMEEKQQRSRLVMHQARQRMKQIQYLHMNLKMQQQSLLEKEKILTQNYQKYEKPPYLPLKDNSHLSSNQSINWQNSLSRKRKLLGTASTNGDIYQNDTSVLTFCRRNNLIAQSQKAQDNKSYSKPETPKINSKTDQNPKYTNNTMSPLPPLPPKKIFQKKPQNSNKGSHPYHEVRKNIEMVDSVIMIREEQKNERVQQIESRLIQYPR